MYFIVLHLQIVRQSNEFKKLAVLSVLLLNLWLHFIQFRLLLVCLLLCHACLLQQRDAVITTPLGLHQGPTFFLATRLLRFALYQWRKSCHCSTIVLPLRVDVLCQSLSTTPISFLSAEWSARSHRF